MKDKDKKERIKAVALKYASGEDSAPRLVAKGRGLIAEKILELARKHGVPVTEDHDLIEALSALDIYEDIPEELYKAVAEVLAFIYRLQQERFPKT